MIDFALSPEIEDVRQRVANKQMREHIYIIDTHLLILNDQMLIDDTIQTILVVSWTQTVGESKK